MAAARASLLAFISRIFRDIMAQDGVSFLTRWDAWLGVRIGGGLAWHEKRPSDA